MSPLPVREPQVAEGGGGAATPAEVAADLAGMDEHLMDVQEKFASLQRFEARHLPAAPAYGAAMIVESRRWVRTPNPSASRVRVVIVCFIVVFYCVPSLPVLVH